MNNISKLTVAVGLSEMGGIIGSIFTASTIQTWYVNLVKPSISPPNWVFGPIWTILYAFMGIAAFIVWKKGLHRNDVRIALCIFIVQLVLNVLWSVIFFGYQNPGGAFIEIIFLWLAVLVTTILFFNISKLSAWFLIPYIAWVSFAVYLNYLIWMLNKN